MYEAASTRTPPGVSQPPTNWPARPAVPARPATPAPVPGRPLRAFGSAAAAGAAGSLVMSAFLEVVRAGLPASEDYPWPPHGLITAAVAHRLGMGKVVDTLPYWAATALSHVAYGAAAALPMPLLMRRPSALRAALYGVGVWVASYAGWLPLLGIHTFPTQHPVRRTAAMIAGHIVWALVTAGLLALSQPRRRSVWLEGPEGP